MTPEQSSPLSPLAFQALGLEQIAYIRPTVVDGRQLFTVHRADGVAVFAADERTVATAAILQNNLRPVSVH